MRYLFLIIMLLVPLISVAKVDKGFKYSQKKSPLIIKKPSLSSQRQHGEIDIYIKGNFWRSMTLAELDTFFINLELFDRIKESMRKGKVRLSVLDSVAGKKPGSKCRTRAILTCVSKANTILWQQTFMLIMHVPKDNKSQLKFYYEKASKWGFPITGLGCLIFFFLWL